MVNLGAIINCNNDSKTADDAISLTLAVHQSRITEPTLFQEKESKI